MVQFSANTHQSRESDGEFMNTICMNTSLLIRQIPLIIYFKQEDCNE